MWFVWIFQLWWNKVVVGFMNLGVMYGDKLNFFVMMVLFVVQYGMIWVGFDIFLGKLLQEKNCVGGWLGVMV